MVSRTKMKVLTTPSFFMVYIIYYWYGISHTLKDATMGLIKHTRLNKENIYDTRKI